MSVPGYCRLCRTKEIELFGDVVNVADERHRRAVREAGCGHPAEYDPSEARDKKEQIIDIGGWHWRVDDEANTLLFLDDDKSFADAVAFLMKVNQLRTAALAPVPKVTPEASEGEATQILPVVVVKKAIAEQKEHGK
jgi:hypothetical protein